MLKTKTELVIYQAKNGAIEIRGDFNSDTIWASQKQISEIFGVNTQAVTKHIKNIYSEGELSEKATCSKMDQVQIEGNKEVKRKVKFYNLDMTISIGYRVNSKTATQFRIWATQTLKQHITQGYSLNKKILGQNKELFLKTLADLKTLSQYNALIEAKDILSLIQSFSTTFFNLESYDKNNFPKQGTQVEVSAEADDLYDDIQKLKQMLIKKSEATGLFAQEKQKGKLKGILGSVFQTAFGQDAYPSVEEKAAHLLYFVVKNYPFNDGNKRSGAFAFIWFLQKANYDFIAKISPETLTALTLLIAESNPQDKEKMIGIILLLLNTKH